MFRQTDADEIFDGEAIQAGPERPGPNSADDSRRVTKLPKEPSWHGWGLRERP